MKTTNALAVSMRKLLANLHPPNPPTARESQQLLDVLQKSFKSRLDEQHPPPAQRNLWSRDHDNHDIPVGGQSTSSHATNTHLSSILANPVLRSLDGLRTRQDAILRFDKLTTGPDPDIPRLVGLLRQYGREVVASDGLQQRERLSDRLNSWLHITNTSSRQKFFLNDAARAASIDLSMTEQNEAILWTWLRMIYERHLIEADIASAEWLEVEDHLVSGLMRIAIQHKNNNDAAQQFIEACRYRSDSGRGVSSMFVNPKALGSSYRPLMRSGKRLASAIVYHRHKHGIDAALLHEVLQYLPAGMTSLVSNSAFCAVYDLKEPTAKLVYTALRENTHRRKFIEDLAKARSHHRRISLVALLDASKLALEEGNKSQASFLIDFVTENYPEYSSVSQDEQLKPETERHLHFAPS